jgi:hypothetical protein
MVVEFQWGRFFKLLEFQWAHFTVSKYSGAIQFRGFAFLFQGPMVLGFQ